MNEEIHYEMRRAVDILLQEHMIKEDKRFDEMQENIRQLRADDELVIALATAMNKTEEDIQIVFELAQTL